MVVKTVRMQENASMIKHSHTDKGEFREKEEVHSITISIAS